MHVFEFKVLENAWPLPIFTLFNKNKFECQTIEFKGSLVTKT